MWAGPRDGHAEDTALRVNKCAALAGRIERQIETQETVDGTATHAVPSPAHIRDHAEARERRARVVADREH